MKALVLIFYSLGSFIYLLLGDNSRYWGGFNHINIYAIIALLCLFCLKRDRLNILEQVLLKFIVFYNLSLSLLTVPCIWGNKDWVNPVVYWWTVFMGLIFVLSLAYGWIKYTNELGKS